MIDKQLNCIVDILYFTRLIAVKKNKKINIMCHFFSTFFNFLIHIIHINVTRKKTVNCLHVSFKSYKHLLRGIK